MRVDAILYARAQMGLSLAFHIVFAAAGVALPLLMVIADALWMRTRHPAYRELSERLAKGTGVLFAVGAVSGTVLSFELGLLWPMFMQRFGALVGLPFALEGFAFFTEAIFLGIYLYGRGRVTDRFHLFAGIMVAVSGAASAFFVTLVNAFMNGPAETVARLGVGADPVAAMWSPSWRTQTVHVLLASYEATAFAMAGIHAALLLRDPRRELHRKALAIALSVAAVAALAQPLSGDRSAKHIAVAQPLKLAAAEALFQTTAAAPLHLGGWPDVDRHQVSGALEIPGALSFLAFGDTAAPVRGLLEFPRDEWPPVARVHLAFQVMVGAGSTLAALAVLAAALAIRRRQLPDGRKFLLAVVVASPLGFVALEAGWLVTEWGRQPWVVRGLMRTAEAVGPATHGGWPFWTFSLIYLFLGAAVAYLLVKQIGAAHRAAPLTADSSGDVGPRSGAPALKDNSHATV
ncbi:MAG: cytochrome ubiquinol oxidase subunit I [Myxococcales bacterium]